MAEPGFESGAVRFKRWDEIPQAFQTLCSWVPEGTGGTAGVQGGARRTVTTGCRWNRGGWFQFPTALPSTVTLACSETVCDSPRLLRAGAWVGICLEEKHFIRRFENYPMPLNAYFRAVEC